MASAEKLKEQLKAGCFDGVFGELYQDLSEAALRYASLIDRFTEKYGGGDLRLFSAPGRTEIGGNHTDHQRGRVLAAAVDLDIIAVVRESSENRARISSPGYGEINVSFDSFEPCPEERESSAALVRGMAAGFAGRRLPLRGFDAFIDSKVYSGSGLSSSAAFETLIGVILRGLGGGKIDAHDIACLSQQAENRWFGKPCGLMDQMASAVGGLVAIDFENPDAALAERIDFDFAACGHALCVTGPIGSHADLTGAYAAIPGEMRMVAGAMGKEYLREIEPADFYAALPELFSKCPDRALLRAMHFFSDNERVPRQAEALMSGNFSEFLRLVNESGRSSFQYLQNVCHGSSQRLAIALAESGRLLGGRGAFRVHGGGFAGTILAFVPDDLVCGYRGAMDRLFGMDSCIKLSIRPAGALEIIAR